MKVGAVSLFVASKDRQLLLKVSDINYNSQVLFVFVIIISLVLSGFKTCCITN